MAASIAAGIIPKRLLTSVTPKVQYDFIIIGAGPGGGPLAANLAKAGYDVALLDAGFDPLSKEAAELNAATQRVYETPGFFAGSSEHPVMSWDYFVDN